MMKVILFSLVFHIVNLNGRFISTVIGTKSEETNSEGGNIESLEIIKKNSQEPVLMLPNSLDNTGNFFEETEKQELLLPSQTVVADSPLLDKIEVSSELNPTAEAVVFSSADTVAELQNRVKNQFKNEKTNGSNQFYTSFQSEKQEYVVHAEPKIHVQTITEETLKAEVNESESVPKSSQEEPKRTAPEHEDIPSFSEWTQKQLAEAEKKKSDQNETSERFTKTRGKFRNKNYASPDCGAKIVAANPESLSSSAVLSSLKDEYMLNYCTNRIWFVVELCEAIQAKQLDLANFELFSSSPKHFSVFISHRFPTRDWSNVGKFTAQDSRDVQTFNLHPHLFGKFVKVELHSHYGREQFCPISWVGVYGTSEYEVLAKEDERHLLPEDDDPYEEDLLVGSRRDSPKNLFSSATDAVLSIVKKATAPFMKADSRESSEKSSDSKSVPCVTPRYITVCNNCSQAFYDEVFDIISCEHFDLDRLIAHSFVKQTLINSETCTKFGLDFNSLRTGAPFPSKYFENPRQEVNYLTVMLTKSFVAALCNVLAVQENKVVVNTTLENIQSLRNITERTDSCNVNPSKSEIPVSVKSSTSCEVDCPTESSYPPTKTSIFADIFKSSQQFSKKIEPTKTLSEDEVKMLPPSDFYSETSSKVIEERTTELLNSGHLMSTAVLTIDKKKTETENTLQNEQKASVEFKREIEKEPEPENKNENENGTNSDSTLESIISDLNEIEKNGESPSSSFSTSTSNLPTESIFLRLANRIKNLEINMSLSSTYLEELSKRYRVQLDLLSKTLNLTIQKMEKQSKADEEKERKREKEMIFLRMQLANLTRDVSSLLREKNSWRPRASSISQHMFFISVEILLVWTVFSYWKRSSESKSRLENSEDLKKIPKKSKRRNSLEGVKGHETPRRKVRRPSDEALEIALSRNYREEIFKKRRRKKKDSKCSINVIQLKRKSEEAQVDTSAERSKPSFVSEEIQVPEFIPKTEIEITNRFALFSSPNTPPENTDSDGKLFQGFSSPIFMKTALAARNSRLKLAFDKESSQEQSITVKADQDFNKKERKGSNGIKKYMKKFF